MKLWIRVDAAAPRDPTIAELAATLGLSVPHALGHLVLVWSTMAEHAVDGSLARVSDATLETWAGWRGRKGRFADAFRNLFVDTDSHVVHGWLDRQGALLDRMERDRRRHRKPADTPPPPPTEPPRNLHGVSTETLRDSASTERNGTERREAAQRVCARIPESDHATLDALLGLLPNPDTWCAEMEACAEGMRGAAHLVSGPELGQAVRDFYANGAASNPTLRGFRAYIASAKREQGKRVQGAAAPGTDRKAEARFFLDVARDFGLLQPVSRADIEQAAQRAEDAHRVNDAGAFVRRVLAVKPWELPAMTERTHDIERERVVARVAEILAGIGEVAA